MKVRNVAVVVLMSVLALAQAQKSAPAKAPAKGSPELEAVLSKMDAVAATFRTAEANFNWDQYQKIVDEHDVQAGKVYFRRAGKDIEMAADISQPASKYVLYSGGKVQVYEPKIDQVTAYDAGKNRSDVESFLVLGFGGRGHDLQKSFAVAYGGRETVDGVATEKLELTPKTQRARNIFDHITLWIDPVRGVSVQQKFTEPSGNFRIAKYTNIKLNEKIGEDIFKLKTTSKTRYVNPQG